MEKGNKAPYPLTERERNLVDELCRKHKLDFGIVECVLYYQDGEIVRIEVAKIRESIKL